MANFTVTHPTDLVVVIDDDEGVREALTFSLEAAQFRVRAISSAEDLLGHELPAEPFCLVVDERLPGMSGFNVIRELRRRGVEAPAIMITTLPSPDLRASTKAAGIPIIEKPLISEELVSAIRAAQGWTARRHPPDPLAHIT